MLTIGVRIDLKMWYISFEPGLKGRRQARAWFAVMLRCSRNNRSHTDQRTIIQISEERLNIMPSPTVRMGRVGVVEINIGYAFSTLRY